MLIAAIEKVIVVLAAAIVSVSVVVKASTNSFGINHMAMVVQKEVRIPNGILLEG
jgi:hypothetical protein